MAVVLAFRVAIALTPIVYRVVAAGGSTYPGAIERGLVASWDRLQDDSWDPAELQEEMSAGWPEDGAAFSVTDFTGTFELRKLQWRLSRAPTGSPFGEDQDVMTFHFIKAAAGVPGTYNDATDLAAVETALNTFWGSLGPWQPINIVNDQYRWYKDGPAFWHLNTAGDKYLPVTPNPAIRVTEVNSPGTGTGNSLPPQVAQSVTEITTFRKNWGRFYLPPVVSSKANGDGRLATANVDSMVGWVVTFYNACRSAGMVPVVFSIPKVARPTAGGGELAAQAGIAFEVSSIRMDDLFDVIRRRRYSAPTYRKTTVLT